MRTSYLFEVRNADTVFDHQAEQLAAINEDDLLFNPSNKVARVRAEIRRREKYSLTCTVHVEASSELLDGRSANG